MSKKLIEIKQPKCPHCKITLKWESNTEKLDFENSCSSFYANYRCVKCNRLFQKV